jgi:hypothetical protein
MKRKIILTSIILFFLAVIPSFGQSSKKNEPKKEDPQQHEKELYEQKKELKESIEKGQKPDEIVAIMGPPEEVESFVRKSETITVWYYDHRDVRIEFAKGVVSAWFLRFMPDKPPESNKYKCDLCEKDKKEKKDKDDKKPTQDTKLKVK